MRFIDVFVKKILEEKGSFDMEWTKDGCKDVTYYHFMQDVIGNARYVYGSYSWNNHLFYANIRDDVKLVAIVSDNKVYIIEEFMLNANSYYLKDKPLPERAVLFYDYVRDVNNYANDEVLKEYLSTLKIPDVYEEMSEDVVMMARKLLFTGGKYSKEKVDLFSADDVAHFLCGHWVLGLKNEIIGRLSLRSEYWTNEKTFITKVEKAMQEPKLVAEKWELMMAEGLMSVQNAKSVNVEFEMNGVKASGKMNPDKLMRFLIGESWNGKIDDYDFLTRTEGEKVYKKLNANWRENPLMCKHITTISYGKKLLYDERLVEVDA